MANSAFTATGTSPTVAGITGQIVVSYTGSTATVGIDPSYVGQTSIITLGTITTGTWNATPVTVPYGGTGSTSFTAYSVICAGTTSTGAFQNVSGLGTTGYVLKSNGASALPTWQAGGTVTSAGVTSSTLTVTNSPITSSGNINIELPYGVGGKNLILNGDFQVAQRGSAVAVPASTTSYTLDMWQLLTNANQACTVTQAAGATSGSYTAKIQRNSGQTGNGVTLFGTSLTRDMCIGAAGNYVTLSFTVSHGANYSSSGNALTIDLDSGTGTTDVSAISNNGFTGDVTVINQSIAITTTPTRYSYTTASPLGSTVTQLAVTFLVQFLGTAGTDDSYTIQDVKLEIGSTATTFNHMGLDQIMPQIYRFYYRPTFINGALIGVGTLKSGTTHALIYVFFPVQMRAIPTLAVDSTPTNYVLVGGGGATHTVSAIISSYCSQVTGLLDVTSSSLTTEGYALVSNISGVGAMTFVAFSAELST